MIALFKERNVLCVGNAAADARGRAPRGQTAIVYMTWRRRRSEPVLDAPNIAIVRDVVNEVVERGETDLTRQQLFSGVKTIKRRAQERRLQMFRGA